MNIEGEGYTLKSDPDARLIELSGSLRLNGMPEYAPILEALNSLLLPGQSRIDLSQLAFLNSSGIAALSKFIIGARAIEGLQLTLIGSANIPWQGKSLKNLQRLLPSMQLSLQ